MVEIPPGIRVYVSDLLMRSQRRRCSRSGRNQAASKGSKLRLMMLPSVFHQPQHRRSQPVRSPANIPGAAASTEEIHCARMTRLPRLAEWTLESQLIHHFQ